MNSVLEGRPALKKEVEKIAEVAGYLWQNGWAERNGGNITVNITDLARPPGAIWSSLSANSRNNRRTSRCLGSVAFSPSMVAL